MVPGVVLSGGASSRMGRPKALLPIGDETFLGRIARTLREAGVDDTVVVTGAHDREIRAWAESAPDQAASVRFVHNAAFERGQLSSIVAALEALQAVEARDPEPARGVPAVEAMLVTLVDLPLVTADTVRALLAGWRATRAPVVRPRFGQRHGHPVIFDCRAFDALRSAPVEAGARSVVHALGAAVLNVPVPDAGVCDDIDTPEDYARLVRTARPRL